MKLYPRCHPYYYHEHPDGTNDVRRPKALVYTGTGHLLPCCWCNNVERLPYFKEKGFLDDELNVSNVTTVKEIFLSKPWVEFHHMLYEDPDSAPEVCKTKCSFRSKGDAEEF